MKIQELIRSLLDYLDRHSIENEPGEQTSRFKQIKDLHSKYADDLPYSNTPKVRVSNVDAVTKDAGGGMNGSKHPADIRVKDPTDYPAR